MPSEKRKVNILIIPFFSLFTIIFLVIFRTEAFGASITLKWNANDESDLSGYKIYYGISSGSYGQPIDIGNVTTYQLSELNEGTTYYIALTAYDSFNNESEKSNEVSGTTKPHFTTTISITPLLTTTTSSVVLTTSIVLLTTTVPVTTSIPVTTTTPIATTTLPTTTTTTVRPVTTTVPITTTIPSDTTPPTGTITINSGNEVTSSSQVTLTLWATDNGRELDTHALMTFSNDKQLWSNPEPYTNTKTWTLSAGAGTKGVYVKFRDAAGNWMKKPAQDQITLANSNKKLKPVSVTASSEFLPFWSKTQAIDGNTLTLWSTTLRLSWDNEFITLDFATPQQIAKVNLYASNSFIDFFPVNFQIEISTDNITWETIRSERDYTLKSVQPDSWTFNSPFEARYLRIFISKAKTFFIFHLAQIAEIEVYGDDLTEDNTAPPPAVHSSISEEKTHLNHHGGEEVGGIQAGSNTPSVPGRPVITFNQQPL